MAGGGFVFSVKCPGCGEKVVLDANDNPWLVLDRPYCSVDCANAHALTSGNVDTALECPVCSLRQVEVGKTGKKRCVNDHVWESQDGVAVFLRNLTFDEVADLRKQGLHA